MYTLKTTFVHAQDCERNKLEGRSPKVMNASGEIFKKETLSNEWTPTLNQTTDRECVMGACMPCEHEAQAVNAGTQPTCLHHSIVNLHAHSIPFRELLVHLCIEIMHTGHVFTQSLAQQVNDKSVQSLLSMYMVDRSMCAI